MSPRFEIVEARPWHVGQIARRLRFEHRAAVAGTGIDIHRELRQRFNESSFRRAWLIDGRIEGIVGVCGTTISPHGYVWLAFTEEATRYPVAIVKETRKQLDDIMRVKHQLSTIVIHGDQTSLRFARFLGLNVAHPLAFGEDPRIVMELHRSVRQACELRTGATDAPFIIYTAGRSRTAWLSAFLTYGDHVCHNEIAVRFRDMREVASYFSQGKSGSAETAAAPGWKLLDHFVPNIRTVVVLRDIEEIIASFARMEISEIATVDEDKLRKIVTYEDRCLREIAQQPGVLTVNFSELESPSVCKAIFEHCLPYSFDFDWWQHMSRRNIQSDALSLVKYYQENKAEVEGFKRSCKREMISLVRSGAMGRTSHAVS
jgi:hypothetical protein